MSRRVRQKFRTAWALGPLNVARVVVYQAGVRSGLSPVRRLRAMPVTGTYFRPSPAVPAPAPRHTGWDKTLSLFGYLQRPLPPNGLPNWLTNSITGTPVPEPSRPWWQIPDFDPAVGDIKQVWELSRWEWLLPFAQSASGGDAEALARLNAWLQSWNEQNPPYFGPNWKCGQEASIRVMHLAMAAIVQNQAAAPERALLELVRIHLQRIRPTLMYAIAQDNNHGTSEAAALFIGGSWLAAHQVPGADAWARLGRRWLENRARRLIGPQGTFSQYSLNYHRVMLDTYVMAEVWRRHQQLPAFSSLLYQRLGAATEWLLHLVDPTTGDGPNVGANDGARLMPLADTAYRDYRPSVQLASALFLKQRVYETEGPWNHAAAWLGVEVPENCAAPPGNLMADDGGFAVLRQGSAMVLLRYPRFRFRPSQADALHLDLWLGPHNLLRDAGSYSYNTDPQWLQYFNGTAAHNTVQFDDRDQMPRLSRFLFGQWLKAQHVQEFQTNSEGTSFAAGYRDGWGAQHHRHVLLGDDHLRVTDRVAGFAQKAVLRWRVPPGGWQLKHNTHRNGNEVEISSGDESWGLVVQSNVNINRAELLEGWESRHYLEKTPVAVLEIEVAEPVTLTTRIHWTA